MKIGVDVRALQEGHRFRGIGVYLTNLLKTLSRIDNHNEYILYQWPGTSIAMQLELNDKFQARQLSHPSSKPIGRRVKNRLSREIAIDPDQVDVFFQPNPSYGLPKGNIKTVCVLHDVIPFLFRQQYFPSTVAAIRAGHTSKQFVVTKLNKWLYGWQLRQIARATRVISISQSSKNDFLNNFPSVPDNSITVIPLACDPKYQPVTQFADMLDKFDIRQPFLLYVGGIDFRKNVASLLTAYEQLPEASKPQLVLVGNDFDPQNEILEARQLFAQFPRLAGSGQVVRIGFVSVQDLAALYSSTTALIFPSLYEGFGITILEAMSCGCPVVAYRNSSIPEVAEDAALLLDRNENLTSVLGRILKDNELRQDLKRSGLIQAKKFSWKATAEKTLRVLEEVSFLQ